MATRSIPRRSIGIINPTGGIVRADPMGSGQFGAARGERDHGGIDLCCMPGQPVLAPMPGRVLRESKPYAITQGPPEWQKQAANTGLLLEMAGDEKLLLYLWYCTPLPDVIGKVVSERTVIARAESVRALYAIRYSWKPSTMLDHIHVEIREPGPGKIRIEPIPRAWF